MNRPLVAASRPQPAPAPQPAAPAPAPQQAAPAPRQAAPPVRRPDGGFGNEMFQTTLYALMNLGQIVPLPSAIGGLVQALGGPVLGVFNVFMGGMNLVKDLFGLKKAGNTKKSDDFTRIAGSAAIVGGGVALFLAASVAPPVVGLIGAALGTAGFAARAVGIWNDDTRN